MERIVPIIHGWMRINPGLSFMQHGAPCHAAGATQDEFRKRGTESIHWPPYSPDLNPIEVVWNWMKDYIEVKWGVNAKLSYDALREAVRGTWDSITDEDLRHLINGTRKRYEAVIAAEGGYTGY